MNIEDFHDDMSELSSAEDFLDYFDIDYDQKVVHVNRLHILQRFHDNLSNADEIIPRVDNVDDIKTIYKKLLMSAYQDFVASDALTEKVFKVFHMNEPQSTFVPFETAFES